MWKTKDASFTFAVGMAMCIAAEEQEEAEKRTQRRKYSVIPYLKERSFKGRYASDF
ncbi:uncharacterized protein [Drosophila suzukii]|uniref:Uncharacterized protein isoform X4 n=1 Tax=Drosophila suzukii TaxID=28584 RepID=A0ABM4TRY5_DROSZ